jgi:hypothetical protein
VPTPTRRTGAVPRPFGEMPGDHNVQLEQTPRDAA